MFFRAPKSECKDRIQQVSSEIRDESLKCEKGAHEAAYRCLDKIGQALRSETVIGDMVRLYQAETAKLTSEVEAYDPPMAMPELERELAELVGRIATKKESLAEDFENQFARPGDMDREISESISARGKPGANRRGSEGPSV
jgi:hypothetical protein